MKYLLIPILFLPLTICLGQKPNVVDTTKLSSGKEQATQVGCISLSTDATQYILMQPNINVEYDWNRIALGLYAGIIKPDPLFEIDPLADGQYKLPGTVYNGLALKLYLKYYDEFKPFAYWCVQGICKPESFSNIDFTDAAIQDEYTISYNMSESSIVLGFDFLRGYELDESIENCPIHIDFFFGIGFHDRFSNYNISESSSSELLTETGRVFQPQNGNYTNSVFYPTPVIGLKLGFNYHVKARVH